MDEAITDVDVAMDLVTLLFLGSERRVYSDQDGGLERALSAHFEILPRSFAEYFDTSDRTDQIRKKLGLVLASATELEMIRWVGDDLDQFEINLDEKNAALRAAAINTPVQALRDTGSLLCNSIAAKTI